MTFVIKTYRLFIVLILPFQLLAQISPGPLANAHAELEGMSKCTECHVLGKKVSSQKCLDCHSEIQSLVFDKRGYHASNEVTSKECFDCHSDHHGRNFEMARFDADEFDHDLTGYMLEGQHIAIDCRECHMPDNIQNLDIKTKENTYLGLDQECLSCHDDFHEEKLGNDCISCHDFEAFRPASGFDHNETEFLLKGQHNQVSCEECHPKNTRDGIKYQSFSDIEFQDCKSCHDDPHNKNIPGKCSSCHIEESFSTFKGQRNFNHNSTRFKLKGKHRSAGCFDCHNNTLTARSIFQDQKGIDENQCIQCHEDIHEEKLGNDCAKCHQETSFTSLKTMDFFDHNVTDYPLEGHHVAVDCNECHPGKYTEEINFHACKNCHEDFHEGEFQNYNPDSDCKDCHGLNEGFSVSLYTLDQHQETSFPLEGAHLATPCYACHVSEEKWTFRNIGNSCVECHDDIHAEIISEKYYPEQKCDQCHNSEEWNEVTFNHDLTNWSLEGKHKETNCRDCHFKLEEKEGNLNQEFKGLSNECTNCHQNIHGDQFDKNGLTECSNCHDPTSWFPTLFDHNETAFKLEGKHAEIECSACHKPKTILEEVIIEYKMESFECIDCHQY